MYGSYSLEANNTGLLEDLEVIATSLPEQLAEHDVRVKVKASLGTAHKQKSL